MLKLQTAFLLLYSVSAGIRQISDKYLVQQPGRTPLIIEKSLMGIYQGFWSLS